MAVAEVGKYDIVIVGMGPVGATLACLCSRAGMSVAIVDRELAIFDKPRAIVLDHEALRVLQFCGMEAAFFDTVTPHTGTDFIGVDGQLIKLFDPKAPPFELGWAPNVMFIQPELEEALARAMDRCPTLTAMRGVNIASVTQDADGATVAGVDRDGKEVSFRASWVIGADGANSMVREAAGLAMEGMDFAEWWVVLDAWLTGEIDLPKKTTQYCQPERPATYVVGPRNLRRWEIKLLPGEDPASYREEARVGELLSQFADIDALSIWRSAVYRFSAAVADGWRNGCLLIAGDAAHTTPPFLAQGLCAGMRDAGNLAWKLAQVVLRGADPALLDTYETERKPHVAQIIRHAKEFGLIIGELDPAAAAERDRVLGEQLRTGAAPTERQAFVPRLAGGMLDNLSAAAGDLFVQPRIRDGDGGTSLMDDIVPPEFLIVSHDPAMLELGTELTSAWEAIGGVRLLVGDGAAPRGAGSLADAEGLIRTWLDRNDATAAIVRPDRYAYGAASAPSEIGRMVRDIVVIHGLADSARAA
ncbi:3-(3-hydroxyphenyl)propionate hydroxylase [Novosphingobium endophyticum]|uniref:3-(3-hydroxyphenyl)propionate hydroxylase n=1 Tax=Novosphingobium endophyticum TaxID=1955250 RepID=A0A916TSL0_9SPHN|nr:bifunctional 3-(3-hydroxy-phenyl)propionate/3-hydroxycinnamic acid hydroxylase [Novosphingobium endophyticum]GGC01326.1 3-(3-hydroxyphenyl)propionate hydroxylase [Novosphingobium endophyticum]